MNVKFIAEDGIKRFESKLQEHLDDGWKIIDNTFRIGGGLSTTYGILLKKG